MALRMLVAAATTVVTAAATVAVAVPASADPAVAGTYNPLTPRRVLDTRSGLGAPKAALGSGRTLTFAATGGLGAQPVSAVALTITAVAPTRSGHLTVYPGGGARPTVSTLNFEANRDTPNATIMRVPATGTVTVYNGSGGTVQVLADRSGYWTGGTVDTTVQGAYSALTPARVLDTRSNHGAPAAPDSTRTVQVSGHGGVPAGASAVAINLTAVTPTRGGYLTATADPEPPGERTATLSFQAAQTRANFVIVPLTSSGAMTLYDGTPGTVHELVDVLGWFSGNGAASVDGAYVPVAAFRVADTRKAPASPIAPGANRKIAVFANDGSAVNTQAVVVTVIALGPTRGGHLTVWDGTSALPTVSNNNFVAGQSVGSTVIVPINRDGSITVHNASTGSTNVAVDLQGFTTKALPAGSPAARAARIDRMIASAHSVAVH